MEEIKLLERLTTRRKGPGLKSRGRTIWLDETSNTVNDVMFSIPDSEVIAFDEKSRF
jgi:hypothetical protein